MTKKTSLHSFMTMENIPTLSYDKENIPTPSVTIALAENGLRLSLKYHITEKYTIYVDDGATIGTFLHWIYVTHSRSHSSMWALNNHGMGGSYTCMWTADCGLRLCKLPNSCTKSTWRWLLTHEGVEFEPSICRGILRLFFLFLDFSLLFLQTFNVSDFGKR